MTSVTTAHIYYKEMIVVSENTDFWTNHKALGLALTEDS